MKRSAEYAVTSIEKDVYAIKPLNGGRLEQKRAYAYVSGFDVRWYMVRAGSAEVEEDTKRS